LQRLRSEPGLADALVAAGRAALPQFAPRRLAAQLLAAYRDVSAGVTAYKQA
jgi:hypothetical protein